MNARSTTNPRRCSTALLVLALILIGGGTRTLHAQGTFGMLPDQISSRELSRYAKQLGLSDQQRLAIEAFHDEYRQAFAALRDSEIEPFLQESGGMRWGMGLRNQEQTKKAMDDLERIMKRIKTLDDRLFDQVQTILSEEQMAGMVRTRQARERVRLRSGLGRMASFINPAANIDLTELIDDLELPAGAMEAADPLVRRYESTLTTMARKVYDEGLKMTKSMMDQMAAAGINEQSMSDPQQRRQMFDTMRTMWSNLVEQMFNETVQLSDLNRKNVSDFESVLPRESALELFDRFYEQAYPESGAGRDRASRFFELLLGDEELTEEDRQPVLDLQGAFRSTVDRMTRQSADLIDETRRLQRLFFLSGNAANSESQKELDELKERRKTVNDQTIETLSALLGPARFDRFDRRVGEMQEREQQEEREAALAAAPGSGGPQVGDRDGGATSPSDATAGLLGATDPFLPEPMTSRDIERYAHLLALDDTKRDILDSMHEDYLDGVRQNQLPAMRAISAAQAAMWTLDKETGRITPPTAEQVSDLFQQRRNALASIMAADESLFEDLSALVGEESASIIERVRLDRRRAVYARGASAVSGSLPGRTVQSTMTMIFGGTEESTVDLSALLEDIDPGEVDAAALESARLGYEQAVTGLFQSAYESNLAFQEAIEKVSAEGAGAVTGRRPGSWGNVRELMSGVGQTSRAARRQLVALNRQTLSQLEQILPAAAGEQLREAYERRAFPEVFTNADATLAALDRAMALEDLTIEQRSAITEIITESRASYAQICHQMVELRSSAFTDDQADQGPGRWRTWMERNRSMEKTKSEQEDLDGKVLVRLRALLSAEQQRQARLNGRDEEG